MSCPCCAAPLPATDVVCRYCGHRIDFDLKDWRSMRSAAAGGPLQCPDCRTDLEHLEIGDAKAGDPAIRLARCAACLGLFLPLGTLEQLLDSSPVQATSVNHRVLDNLLKANHSAASTPRYRRCPSCSTLMHRKLHGKRSGVIIDSCRDHGLWLDAGELRQLMEWCQAGGRLWDEKRRAMERSEQERRDRLDNREQAEQRLLMEAELTMEHRNRGHRRETAMVEDLVMALVEAVGEALFSRS